MSPPKEKCEQCGKVIPLTWVHKKPIPHTAYAMTFGLVLLCSAKCDDRWCNRNR